MGANTIVKTTATIFSVPNPLSATDCLRAEKVLAFAEAMAQSIQATMSGLNFRDGRLDRKAQRAAGIVHKRLYNRQYRALIRMGRRIDAIARNTMKYEATRVAKSSGATLLTLEDIQDVNTACFVAYLSASMNVRSIFTDGPQKRAFDEIAAMLFDRLKHSPTTNWYAVAMVHPEAEVLHRLTPEERGKLLGIWTEMLGRLAYLMGVLDSENNFDLQNMIVHRGDDSSSWNAAAGAWNKARDHWLSLVYALGMEAILDHFCPPKALRLMAADVVRWHGYSKGSLDDSLHPATKVWRDLPRPWLVFKREAECTRAMVEESCKRHSVSTAGWTEPPPVKRPVPFSPTPELVNGVIVASPFLAFALRKAGWFSGKKAEPINQSFSIQAGVGTVEVS